MAEMQTPQTSIDTGVNALRESLRGLIDGYTKKNENPEIAEILTAYVDENKSLIPKGESVGSVSDAILVSLKKIHKIGERVRISEFRTDVAETLNQLNDGRLSYLIEAIPETNIEHALYLRKQGNHPAYDMAKRDNIDGTHATTLDNACWGMITIEDAIRYHIATASSTNKNKSHILGLQQQVKELVSSLGIDLSSNPFSLSEDDFKGFCTTVLSVNLEDQPGLSLKKSTWALLEARDVNSSPAIPAGQGGA